MVTGAKVTKFKAGDAVYGYALFGGNPTPGHDNPMRNVVTLTVPIAQIGTVERALVAQDGFQEIDL